MTDLEREQCLALKRLLLRQLDNQPPLRRLLDRGRDLTRSEFLRRSWLLVHGHANRGPIGIDERQFAHLAVSPPAGIEAGPKADHLPGLQLRDIKRSGDLHLSREFEEAAAGQHHAPVISALNANFLADTLVVPYGQAARHHRLHRTADRQLLPDRHLPVGRWQEPRLQEPGHDDDGSRMVRQHGGISGPTPSTLELTVSNAESVRGWPGPKSRRC